MVKTLLHFALAFALASVYLSLPSYATDISACTSLDSAGNFRADWKES